MADDDQIIKDAEIVPDPQGLERIPAAVPERGDVREIAARYISEGWSVLPIPKGSKAPNAPDWVNTTFGPDDFEYDSNIGIRLGVPSGHLIDVDLDCAEAVLAAKHLLPSTERKHGRPGTGDSHYWYICEGAKSEKWLDTDGHVLVELRSTGGQTVVPPSIHPSGDLLYWASERGPSKLALARARAACRDTSAAALLGRHWPSGSRHVAARDLAGFLAARELDITTIEAIIRTAATIAKDDEIDDRVRVARDTVQTFKAGGKTTGGPTLEAAVGKAVVALLVKWYGGNDAVHSGLIDKMNKRHFVVTVGKDVLIGDLGETTADLKERDPAELTLRGERGMHLLYANKLVKVGQRNKKKAKDEVEAQIIDEFQTHYDIWRKHVKRREHRRLVFAPPPLTAHPKDYNLWTGYAVKPLLPPKDDDAYASPESLRAWVSKVCEPKIARYLELVHDVVCGGEPHRQEEYFQYLLDILALTVQFPGIPSEVAVVLKGSRGAGKGMFIRNFGSLFGHHYAQISKPEQIVGKFNAAISGKVVVFADEAFFAGDKRDLGALKVIITEPMLSIERKGIDPVPENNFVHLFMASNEKWHTPAGFQERRFFALAVTDTHRQDTTFFGKLKEEIDEEWRSALLSFFMARQLTDERKLELRTAPRTEELRVQQEHTLDTEMRWWRSRLVEGTVGLTPGEEMWPEWISYNDLVDDYLHWCDRYKINRRLDGTILVRDVLKPWLRDQKRCVEDNGRRVNKRRLVALAEARGIFDKEAGTTSEWGDGDGDMTTVKGSIPNDKIPF